MRMTRPPRCSALDDADAMMMVVAATPLQKRVTDAADIGVEPRPMPVAVRQPDTIGPGRLDGTGRDDRRPPGDGLRVQNGDRVDIVDPAGALRLAAAGAGAGEFEQRGCRFQATCSRAAMSRSALSESSMGLLSKAPRSSRRVARTESVSSSGTSIIGRVIFFGSACA